MGKSGKGALARFVTRVMKTRKLTQAEVSKRSRKPGQPRSGLAPSYVSQIMSGKVYNLTADKIAALARGLGVEPLDLFCASASVKEALPKPPDPSAHKLPDVLAVLELMEKVVVNPDLTEMIEEVAAMSERKQAMVVAFVEDLREMRARRRKGRKGGQNPAAN
ncbi:MAG TPA: helix-turn-helix transcriptional regulator [Blastocatellia bacterium]|nr:helix-turn-helix transcriptional regulator [Blastocatellia bacterium]